MFWFEIRIAVSIVLLLTQWYYIGWITDFLHFVAVCELSRLARLPAEIESVEFFFNDFHSCSAIAHGVQVKAPPMAMDDRWELEQIITVDAVHVSFPLFETLFLYIFSFGGLAVMHSVHFYGLRVNVEGYRDSDDVVAFNVSLIGKRTKKSKTDDSLSDDIEEQAIDMGMSTMTIIENYYGGKTGYNSETPSSRSTRGSVGSVTPSPQKSEDSHQLHSSHSEVIFNKISEHFSLIKEGAKAINETVIESGGFLNATKAKLSDVYHKTKHSIEESIQDRIDALHVQLSGPEPMQVLSDFRFVCDHLFYDRVEIHMFRALPPQIRHLESKPLIVDRLEFFNLGRGPANELIRSKSTKRHSKSVAEVAIMSSSSLHGSSRERTDKSVLPSDKEVGDTQLSSKTFRSFAAIDIYDGGLDFRIFKYYFERRMLYALCKYNAGKHRCYNVIFNN